MKLLTWNIQWGRGVDGRVDLARIAQHALSFDADVLLLQEIADGFNDAELPGADGSDQYAALARLLPGYALVDGVATDLPATQGRRRRFGNLIASRHPVEQVQRHLLPWPLDASVRSMQRGAVEATVRTPFGPLRVMATHLEYFSASQRLAQAQRLHALHVDAWHQASVVRPGNTTDGPFDVRPRGPGLVLAGDFNCIPGSPAYSALLAPCDDAAPPLRDACDVLHGDAPHRHTVGLYDHKQWPDGSRCFDHVFVSADLAPRLQRIVVDTQTQASDHQPVWIELSDAA